MAESRSIAFDLDRGILTHVDGTAEDSYRSGTVSFEPFTLDPSETGQIQVRFVNAENDADQELVLRTLGTGGATNQPSTFATHPTSGHIFGPGLILDNSGAAFSGTETLSVRIDVQDTVVPTSPPDPALAQFEAIELSSTAAAGLADVFDYVFLPDMLDDPDEPLQFSGFTVNLEAGSAPVTLDTLDFNLISADIGTIQYAPPPPTVPTANLLSGPPSGVNLITGTNKKETLTGTAGADGIDGRNGRDQINGLGNDDYLFGVTGEDRISGGDGNDYIRGGNSRDDLRGGPGNDEIYGDRAEDSLYGGLDDDELWGGHGNDSLYGENGNDALVGEIGDDLLDGGAGGDVYVLRTGEGNDRIQNWDSDDRIALSGLTAGEVDILSEVDSTLFSWADGSVRVDASGLLLNDDFFFVA